MQTSGRESRVLIGDDVINARSIDNLMRGSRILKFVNKLRNSMLERTSFFKGKGQTPLILALNQIFKERPCIESYNEQRNQINL